MKSRLGRLILAAGAAALLVGCEGDWETGDDVKSWNDRYNWVNFSGVYRGINGGVLVTDYSATPGTPGVTNSQTDTIVGSGGGASSFNGVLSRSPVVKGSVKVQQVGGGFALTDDGEGHLVSGGDASGTINYGTGAWSVDLKVPFNGSLYAEYLYSIAGAAGQGSAAPGTSGKTIYSFTVQHDGEHISATDNNGATYEGKMGSVRTSGGADGENAATPASGDDVVAQYNLEGVSAAGYSVTMVGTFQGVVTDSGESFRLSNRKMFGQWLEEKGKNGDINGESSPIAITAGSGGEAAPTE